jgi:hypothetical protein
MPTIQAIVRSHRLVTASQARLNLSHHCVRDMRDSLRKTYQAIAESRALIHLSDRLVQRRNLGDEI